MKKALITFVCAAATLCGTAMAQSQTFEEVPAPKSHNSNLWGLVYAGAITENVAGKVNIHPISDTFYLTEQCFSRATGTQDKELFLIPGATHISNLKDYDIVFVSFPNWWYDMPMPLYSFFDEYDFGGKTVIPFCTHGGSRFSSAIETIRTLEPKATVLDGRTISRDRVPESGEDILK